MVFVGPMSALPQSEFSPDEGPRKAASAMVDALVNQAACEEKLGATRRRIRQAAALGADVLNFCWLTRDDREVDLRVYFLPGETPEIVIAETYRLDGREPTIQERVSLDEEFDDALNDFGNLWMRVISAIWDQHRRPR